jgi:hypothetical protein
MTPLAKKIWLGVAFVAVAGGIFVIVKKAAKNEEDDGQSPGKKSNATDNTAPTVKAPPVSKNPSFPLQKGSNNKYVGDLQRALKITADNIILAIKHRLH